MSLISNMMGGGVPSGMARAINGSVAPTVSAAGTGQSDATALKADLNILTTVGSGSGVILPSCEVGDKITVYNSTGTNSVLIYPDVGSTINQLSANTAGILSPYTGSEFTRVTSTKWMAIMSA